MIKKQYLYGEVDYTSLVHAHDTLKRIFQTARSEAEKMGTVQAFEICYELSWKTMRKILRFRGVEVWYSTGCFSGGC